MPNSETDPLVGSNQNSRNYYFLNKDNANYTGGTTNAVRDGDGAPVVEEAPMNSSEDEFAPRKIGKHNKHPSEVMSPHNNPASTNGGGPSFFQKLFGGGGTNTNNKQVQGLKPRKAPIKIEPKVFFANERTFLAWMHLSVILAGASIAILAFAEEQNPVSQLYGVILLPVSISFIIYSMYQYARRAKMIRHRMPGPYEDTIGPTVLGIMLMISIVAQFALKLYAMHL